MATIAMLKEEQTSLAWLQESGLPFVAMSSDEQITGAGLNQDETEEPA